MLTPPRTERATTVSVRDLPFRGGTLALVELDNPDAPNTLGPQGLAALTGTLAGLAERARAGEIAAAAVTGRPGVFCGGAELSVGAAVRTREEALRLGQAGHEAFGLLAGLGVPTFALLDGVALGGGFELALACDYRVASDDVRALGLPETSLGLVPGWGGAYRVPRLVGVDAALDVILWRPAANRPYRADEALDLGLVDAVLPAQGFRQAALAWAEAVASGELAVARRHLDDSWDAAVSRARALLDDTPLGVRPAPRRALELIAAARHATPQEAFAAEDEALADLAMSDEARAAVHTFGLVAGAKRPAGAPDPALARPVAKAGVVGAGLMAAQIATLLARRLGVPVVMRDIDDERVAAGLRAVRSGLERQVRAGRLGSEEAESVAALVTASTDISVFGGCDLVVEAVTEVLDVKRRVFAELEPVIGPDAVLATNTSALSVTAMADGLAHPERVVGLHFFNPVAAMPLVEVVRAEHTSDAALATAFDVTARLGKTAVGVRDRPGFVVNRLLVLLLGMVLDQVEHGTPVEVADRALDPLGLPMPPFELLDLVGPAVGLHVLTSLREDLGDRVPVSPGLARLVAEGRSLVVPGSPGLPRRVDPAIQAAFDAQPGPGPDEAGVRDAVLTALTREIGHMLDEGVVEQAQQIDLCLVLGAGWPWHLGGITPYLDRSGYSEKVLGRRLLPDGLANVVR